MTPFASSREADQGADTAAGGDVGTATRARVTLLMFASAREAAGTGREQMSASTVSEVLDEARCRYGERFAAVLERCRVWLNGEPVAIDHPLDDGDEVAVLPPVSGG